MAEFQAAPRLVAGRYRLGTLSGRGGMGTVWQATDELIGRQVAVKELRPPAGLSADEGAVVSQRALREARTAGQVHHPGVIAIHDIVPATADDDAIYIVMELVTAPTLADILSQGALPEDRVLTLGTRILAALAAAHEIGVVHRDVKPGNIMVLPGDEVKLIDFGIAHAMDETRLTRDGIMGSTGYMAPELFHGQDPSPASDLWSAGATLCHAILGHGPFDRDSTAATLHAILYDDLPSLPCPPPLSTVITGLLTRDTGRRMTGQQARDLLESTVDEHGDTKPVRNVTAVHTVKQSTGVRRYLILGAMTLVAIVGTILLIPVFAKDHTPTGPATSPPSAPSAARFQLAGSTMTTQTKLAHTAVLSPDGRTLLTIVTKGPIRLWDVSDPAKATALGEPLGTATVSPYSAAFSARTLAICDGNAIQLWNLTDLARPSPLGKPIQRSGGCSAVALSVDGRKLATANLNAQIQLLDVANPAQPVTLATATTEKPVDSMVFGEDGRTLLTVTTSETVQLWDIAEPTRMTALNQSLSASSGVKFTYAAVSPAGNTLATAGGDQAIQLWKVSDLVNPKPAPVATLPPEPIYGGIRTEPLRFGPDGHSLGVSNTKDGVQLWDIADPARPTGLGLLSRNDIPGERVDSAMLSPDKKTLTTTSYDNGVYLWRVTR